MPLSNTKITFYFEYTTIIQRKLNLFFSLLRSCYL